MECGFPELPACSPRLCPWFYHSVFCYYELLLFVRSFLIYETSLPKFWQAAVAVVVAIVAVAVLGIIVVVVVVVV